MEYNEKYQGTNAIAITTFNSMYGVKVSSDKEQLSGDLSELRRVVPSIKIVKIYDRVNIGTATDPLREAAKKLEAGEEVNLERLLE